MLLQWSIFLFLYLLEDSDALFLTESQSFHPSIAILSFLYSSLRLPPPFPPAPVPIGSKRGTTLPHHPEEAPHIPTQPNETDAGCAIHHDSHGRDFRTAPSALRARGHGGELVFPPAQNPVRPTAPPRGGAARRATRPDPSPRHDDLSPRVCHP